MSLATVDGAVRYVSTAIQASQSHVLLIFPDGTTFAWRIQEPANCEQRIQRVYMAKVSPIARLFALLHRIKGDNKVKSNQTNERESGSR